MPRSPQSLRTSGRLIGLCLVVLATGCQEEVPKPPPVDLAQFVPPAPTAVESAAIPFADVTQESGLLSYRHETGAFLHPDGKPSRYLPECMGPGVLLFDADGDGDLDIYVPNGMEFDGQPEKAPRPTGRLYLHQGALRYLDATASAGLAIPMMGMGAVAADDDGDGDLDLFVLTYGGVRRFENRGSSVSNAGRTIPTFFETTEKSGLKVEDWTDRHGHRGPDWSVSAAHFDADGDLDLDLFVVNYVRWCPENDVFESLNGKDKSYAVPRRYEGHTCRLFRQIAPGRYEDATEALGVTSVLAKGMSLSLWDFNDDGRLDVAVSNDGQPNFLYLSKPDGGFKDCADEANIAYDGNGRTRAGMGIDAEEYALDGAVGIPIGNFSNEPVSLFRSEGKLSFRDIGQISGVAGATHLPLTFGLTWIDADCDGLLDLVLANGHLEPEIQRVQGSVSYAQRPMLLRQKAPHQFVDVTEEAGKGFVTPMVARGLARGDLDQDGDEDLVIAENGRGLRLLRNDRFTSERPAKAGEVLRFELEGPAVNPQAIGTIIDLEFEGGMRRRLIARGGSSYGSQSALLPIVGLQRTGYPLRVRVRWPDGKIEELAAERLRAPVIRLSWPR